MATQNRNTQLLCVTCEKTFIVDAGRGKARKYCTEDCRPPRKSDYGACCIKDCEKRARGTHSLCEMHYGRKRRSGTFEVQPYKDRFKSTSGYWLVRDKHHPLANKSGHVYQHRQVLYGKIGPGYHQCHWCNKLVTWGLVCTQSSDALVVDHVDSDKENNTPDNLVPSCAICNQRRGTHKMTKTMQDRHGVWIEYNGKKQLFSDWAKGLGISRHALYFRLQHWSLADALTTPRRDYRTNK